MKRVGNVALHQAGRNHQESPCACAHALAASPDTWEGSSPQNTRPALHGGVCRGGKWRKAEEALEGCGNLWSGTMQRQTNVERLFQGRHRISPWLREHKRSSGQKLGLHQEGAG